MKYCLDGKRMCSKEETHHYLQECFAFPAYYGNTLDSLYDCLTDCCEERQIEILHSADMLEALGDYGKKLLCIFQEVETITLQLL